MTTQTVTNDRSAMPLIIAAFGAFVVLAGLFGLIAVNAGAGPSARPGTTSQNSSLRTVFLTEMRGACIKSAEEHGATSAMAASFCGCLADHAATLSSVELIRIGIDPTRLDPQVQVCLPQRTAAAS